MLHQGLRLCPAGPNRSSGMLNGPQTDPMGSGLWGLSFCGSTRVFTSLVNHVYFFNYF
ncbi:hypothetical protein EMIT0111MI5_80010 [Burkholderia sp. IT-111MI5]